MRAIHRTPLLDQIEDRLLLPLEDAVHRIAARFAVLERPGELEPPPPAVHAHVGDLHHPARAKTSTAC
jgi:hypothetical protein